MSGRNSACTSGSGGSLKENRKDPDSDGSDVLVLSPKLRKFTIAISPLKPDKIRKFTGDKDEKTDSEEDECLSVLKSKLQKGRSLDGANKLKQTSLLDFKVCLKIIRNLQAIIKVKLLQTKKTSTSRASNRSDQPKKPKELRLEK